MKKILENFWKQNLQNPIEILSALLKFTIGYNFQRK